MTTETINCPAHGQRPAVPSVDAPEFLSCRTCWYRDWLRSLLSFARRSR